jgi:quinol monooxygenase YgiN
MGSGISKLKMAVHICSMMLPQDRILVRFVTMRFRPEEIDAFHQVFNQSQTYIAARQGCLGVRLLSDKQEPDCFYTWSEWTDEDALNAYRYSELFADVWARTKPLFRVKPTAVSWYRWLM